MFIALTAVAKIIHFSVFQEEQTSEFPRTGYYLAVSPSDFTTSPYAAGVNLSLPVSQTEADAIVERYDYMYNASAFDSTDCQDRWFEVSV